MEILLQDFLRRFWREATPLLDWTVTNWAVTLVVLMLALSLSLYRGKFRK
jgi:uncharacterized membrane protein